MKKIFDNKKTIGKFNHQQLIFNLLPKFSSEILVHFVQNIKQKKGILKNQIIKQVRNQMRNAYEENQYTYHSQFQNTYADRSFTDITQTQKKYSKFPAKSIPASGAGTTQHQSSSTALMNQTGTLNSLKIKKSQVNIQSLVTKYQFNLQELQFFKQRFDNISIKGLLTKKLFRKSMGILGIDHLSYISDRIFLLIAKDQDEYANFEDYIAYLDTIINGSDEKKAQMSFNFLTLNSDDYNKLFYQDIEQMVNQVSLVWKDLSGSTVYPQQQYIQNVFQKLDVHRKGYVEFEDYYNTYCQNQDLFQWYELFNGDEMLEKHIKVINQEQKEYENKINLQTRKGELCNFKTMNYLFGLNEEVTNCLISLKDYEKMSLQLQNVCEQQQIGQQQLGKRYSHESNLQLMLKPEFEKQLYPQCSNNIQNNYNSSSLFLTSILHDQASYINNSFLSASYQGPLSVLQQTTNHLGDQDPEEEDDEFNLVQEKFQLQEKQQQMSKSKKVISESQQVAFLNKLEENIQDILKQTSEIENYLDSLITKEEGLTRRFTLNKQPKQQKGLINLVNIQPTYTYQDEENKSEETQRNFQRVSSIQSRSARITFQKQNSKLDGSCKLDQSSKQLIQRKATISNIPSHKKNKSTRRNISIYVGHENWNLVFVMMIGIRGSVKGLSNLNMYKQLDLQDFTQKNNKDLIRNQTIDSDFIQYRFTDYAPLVFERIRQVFNIDKEIYQKSLGPESLLGHLIMGNMTNLSDLCASTKSFHRFQYYSEDGRFVIRALTKEQAQFVKKILKPYFHYIQQNFQTLIMRLYGMYKIRFNKKGKKVEDSVYFIVTHNVFCTELEIDKRYEIKGSTRNRTARKGGQGQVINKTMSLKELDLQQDNTKLDINMNQKNLLLKQLQQDTQFLASQNIINYYLLLGIHNVTQHGIKIYIYYYYYQFIFLLIQNRFIQTQFQYTLI